MKLDNYGVFVISNLIMKQMSISYLLNEFRRSMSGWEAEQNIRLGWIASQYPQYLYTVKSGDIEGSVLFGAASHVDGSGIVAGGRASIWINGHRSGSIEYNQTREFSKMTAKFYHDMQWAEKVFLGTFPQFKRNIDKYTWVRRT
jgi:hypothetical protein